MYKDDPHTGRIKIFIMAVEPCHRYLNEPGKADVKDIHDDFKLAKPFSLYGLNRNNSGL